MIKISKSIIYSFTISSLLISLGKRIYAHTPRKQNLITTISSHDRNMGKALIDSKWIHRFAYYAPEQDPIKQLAYYFWHFEKNRKKLECNIKQIQTGPISTISPELLGKLLASTYTNSLSEEQDPLFQGICNTYTSKIMSLQKKLHTYLAKIKSLTIPLKQYDAQIRKLSVHIDEAKKQLFHTKKTNNEKKIIELKQLVQQEIQKVENPRRTLIHLKKQTQKEKIKLTKKLNKIIKQIESEYTYVTPYKTKTCILSRDRLQNAKIYLQELISNIKPYVTHILHAIIELLHNEDYYNPDTTKSLLWAFIESKYNQEDIQICLFHMHKAITQSGKTPVCLKQRNRNFNANLIQNIDLLRKKNIQHHQSAKLIYYSLDLKDRNISAQVIRHALKNNLLKDEHIQHLILTLMRKVQQYDFYGCDETMSYKVVSAIIKTNMHNTHNTMMEHICNRPLQSLRVINKSHIQEKEYIQLFKTMITNNILTPKQIKKAFYKALFNACTNGYKALTTMLINTYGINVNMLDKQGHTILHKAAEYGHDQLVEMLITNYYIDINYKNTSKETALHKAACNGHTPVIKVLLSHRNINVNAQDQQRETALYKSILYGHLTACKTLLTHPKIKINILNKKNENILHKAAQSNNLQMMQFILSLKKININTTDLLGETPLHKAAKNKNKDFFYLLINTKGININKKNNAGKTALEIATKCGNTNAYNMILTKKPKKKTKTKKQSNQYINMRKIGNHAKTMYSQLF